MNIENLNSLWVENSIESIAYTEIDTINSDLRQAILGKP